MLLDTGSNLSHIDMNVLTNLPHRINTNTMNVITINFKLQILLLAHNSYPNG